MSPDAPPSPPPEIYECTTSLPPPDFDAPNPPAHHKSADVIEENGVAVQEAWKQLEERKKNRRNHNRDDTQKKKKYYIINTLEEGDRPETPTEKLARLVRETNQLAEEITHNQKEAQLEGDIQQLQQELTKLMRSNTTRLDERTPQHGFEDGYHNLRKTIEQRQNAQGNFESDTVTAPHIDATEGHMLYELYLDTKSKDRAPDQADDWDKRLAVLEGILGQSSPTEEPISLRLAQIESKLAILTQPNYIENLNKALRRLGPDLQKGEALADASAQIRDIHGVLPIIKSLSPAVPLINSRLQTLAESHHRIGQYDDALDDLEMNIKELSSGLIDSTELLHTLEVTLQKSLDSMKENISSLNSGR